jgi:flagellar biosynthesis protein FlhF
MIVRSYTGRSVPEALSKVRKDLGEDALIIETRAIREPGILGRRSGYEVVAAHDDQPARRPAAARASTPATQPTGGDAAGTAASGGPHQDPASHQAANLARQVGKTQGGQDDRAHALEDELHAIRRQLARLASGQGTPSAHLGEELATELGDAELPDELIAELDETLAKAGDRLEPHQRRAFVSLLLARALPCAGAIDWSACRRLLVVGPTGVGKTTTIAKLAGDLVLKQRRRVALVTIDTYRIGATEQLRAYADLLDVPLAVAGTPAQLASVLSSFKDMDNVLIDTAGRSPADSTRVHELKSYCRAAAAGTPGLAVMLCVAANGGAAEFASAVERFSILPLEHAAVTKLDECEAGGRLYGCLRRHHLTINYLTTGQEVPDDIVPATSAALSLRVLREQSGIAV